MRRPWRIAILVVAVLLAGEPGALAGHNDETKKNGSDGNDKVDGPHEPIPNPPIPLDPKAECVFTGVVLQEKGTDPANPLNPVHDHVTLDEVVITCVDLEDPIAGHFNTAFDAFAVAGNDGETDPLADPKEKPDKSDSHGATPVQGWSHSNGYPCGSAWDGQAQNTNKGHLEAQQIGGSQATLQACANPWTQTWFKFVQGWTPADSVVWVPAPPTVYAWGQLAWNDEKKDEVLPGKRLPNCFVAPDVAAVPNPITGTIDVTGTAVIFHAYQYLDMKTLTAPDTANKNDACDFQKKQEYSTSSTSGGGGNGGGGGSRGPKG